MLILIFLRGVAMKQASEPVELACRLNLHPKIVYFSNQGHAPAFPIPKILTELLSNKEGRYIVCNGLHLGMMHVAMPQIECAYTLL